MERHCSPPRARPSLPDPEAAAPIDTRLALPAQPDSIATIRRAVTPIAEAVGLPSLVVEDVRLAVTEACTNVVRHAYDGVPGSIDVTVRPDGDTLLIIVADRGRGISPSSDQRGPGLGLPLIAALCDELQIRHSPGDGSELTMRFTPRGGAA